MDKENKELINLKLIKLLKKFGAGSHKPGSGSAAALNGLLSAELIRTVIAITKEDKHIVYYLEVVEKLNNIKKDIDENIYPKLENLFQQDSDEFHNTIIAREKRDKNKENRELFLKYKKEALDYLKISTETPMKIANLCEKLANYGLFIFENAFKSARGDSAVAISNALTGLNGCISIVDLNLSSLKNDEWSKKIRTKNGFLKKENIILSEKLLLNQKKLQHEAELKSNYLSEIHSFNKISDKDIFKYSEIEKIVRDLQNFIWKYKHLIWKKNKPVDPIEIINPEKIIKVLGYKFKKHNTLGQFNSKGKLYEIAGEINKKFKEISISEQFNNEVQKFTIAHEIGHAILHKKLTFHRDRPLDGSKLDSQRDFYEKQADKFAVYFLMPESQVKRAFLDIFRVNKLQVTNDFLFKININSFSNYKQKFKTKREFSRYISSLEFYDNRSFNSIAKVFSVSTETMAIRLEELNLIEY